MNLDHPLLDCANLTVTYRNGTRAVRELSFTINAGERVAIVGESGCGKTTLVRALLGLLPTGTGISGRAMLSERHELAGAPGAILRSVRGRMIGYVPQNPLTAFDPLRSVGSQIGEAWRCHGLRVDRPAVVRALETVGLEQAESLLESRPSSWSGGMLQRASIITATALRPRLVLADEPTSAVDRPLARRILDLLAERCEALLVVTHDVDLVENAVDRVMVMYAGRIVEDADSTSFFRRQRHPYSRALLAALPKPGILPTELLGDPPRLNAPDTGCAFAPRCPRVHALCGDRPVLSGGVACHFAEAEV